MDIRRSIYGLGQAGTLLKKVLKENLAPHGYFEVSHTTVLWQHTTSPISFYLVVYDFGAKYIDKADVDHLIAALNKYYEISKYWKGGLYCGIMLKWNYNKYINKQYLDISMTVYITKKFQNTNTRYKNTHNIHHIPQTRRNMDQHHRNQSKQMTPSPLALKVSTAFRK